MCLPISLFFANISIHIQVYWYTVYAYITMCIYIYIFIHAINCNHISSLKKHYDMIWHVRPMYAAAAVWYFTPWRHALLEIVPVLIGAVLGRWSIAHSGAQWSAMEHNEVQWGTVYDNGAERSRVDYVQCIQTHSHIAEIGVFRAFLSLPHFEYVCIYIYICVCRFMMIYIR